MRKAYQKTLLAKALKIKLEPQKNNYEKEMIDLAMAWLRGKVALAQMNVVLNRSRYSSSILYTIALIIRQEFDKGNIIIKK